MAAVRVCFTWLGVRKTLSPEQKSQAAESFGAERDFLSAGKKLLDTSHPAFKAVTSVRNQIVSYLLQRLADVAERRVRIGENLQGGGGQESGNGKRKIIRPRSDQP